MNDDGFFAYVKDSCDTKMVRSRFLDTANRLGFSCVSKHTIVGETSVYRRRESDPGLELSFDTKSDHSELYVFPVDNARFLAYTPRAIVEFLSGLCIALDVGLGRMFSMVDGFGTVKETELVGKLEFLGWYQYPSPAIVSRYGIEYLREGPFYKIEEYPNGACCILLADSPQQKLGRVKAAEYLGIKLPKLLGKNPITGQPMEIAWS